MNSPRFIPMPVLVFPGGPLIGKSVREIVSNAEVQFETQRALHEKFRTRIVMSAMDLSVEAEEFGSEIRFSDDEVPTVIGRLLTDAEGVSRLGIPGIGNRRTAVYLETIRLLAELPDKPVVAAGCIGPLSLAGRLYGVSEALLATSTDPEIMTRLIQKTTEFILAYTLALKSAGAQMVIMAEPTAGLLSPRSTLKFSSEHIRRIVEAVQDEEFDLVLHNCGARIAHLPATLEAGSRAVHFGNPMDVVEALKSTPDGIIVSGNLDPAEVFCGSTPETVAAQTSALLEATKSHRNFVPSSGCDIPAHAPMKNLESFFSAVEQTGA
ncbi:MAG: uroporphyrinogen decarboxylase family protein [Bacteroidota bacterium]